jgi:hypothetical protein
LDQSAFANHGSPASVSPTFDANSAVGGGTSARFNGTTSGVNIAAAASLNPTNYTLTYFVNPDGAVQSGAFERLTNRGGDSFETALSNTNQFAYYNGWNNTGQFATANGWTHVAWRNDGANMRLFLNGADTGYSGGAENSLTGNMYIGTRHNHRR